MLALLKLIPLKDILWAIALGAAAWFIYNKGELRIEKKDAALRAAAAALNTASQSLADIQELNIGKVYEKYITLPPIASTGLVCHAAAPVQSSAAGGGPKADAAAAAVPAGSFDPSGPLLTLLRDSDEQITGLIATVLILENELQGKTK